MTFEEIIQKIDPQIYQNLRTAIELGKWPDGRTLTREQKEISMQAVIYYENQANIDESDRIGFIDRAKVEATPCASSAEPKAVDVINVG
ncbi:YeaC family protein [Alkalimarinus coralli]|uniref:YeaC family protein n=1 Tax=Alkalimarinus coralli TaxID=2935863 RepID=UPI00202B4D6C|nr:DUF1315 family protein [Alkalimarinus coralli]